MFRQKLAFIETKNVASILKVPDDKAQIVSSKLHGLNAKIHSHMVFAVEPHTFSELSDLATRIPNYAIMILWPALLFLLILLSL